MRTWNYYLCYCEALFAERYVSLLQIEWGETHAMTVQPAPARRCLRRREPTMSHWGWGISLAERGWFPTSDSPRHPSTVRPAFARTRTTRAAQRNRPASALRRLCKNCPWPSKLIKPTRKHYELPPEYFELVLGSRRKYSCCYLGRKHGDLDQAEDNSLQRVCANAGIVDGQRILDLGCGWGSLTLWLAEHYPASKIVGVSNSTRQRASILNAVSSGTSGMSKSSRSMSANRNCCSLRIVRLLTAWYRSR